MQASYGKIKSELLRARETILGQTVGELSAGIGVSPEFVLQAVRDKKALKALHERLDLLLAHIKRLARKVER